MSIRFPDFQVLIARSDQVPKVSREGDPTGAAGRMAPQVSEEFAARERRVELNRELDRVREGKDERKSRQQGKQESRRQPGARKRIDLRA
ncbi:MAG TPA: hypothetical protein PLM25_10400 [Limnochordia bacterium]|jgi:hypothetical protein|nr:hypothetical protein [Limnochordia bacterium]